VKKKTKPNEETPQRKGYDGVSFMYVCSFGGGREGPHLVGTVCSTVAARADELIGSDLSRTGFVIVPSQKSENQIQLFSFLRKPYSCSQVYSTNLTRHVATWTDVF
jgi:hypothetical protein